MVQEALVETRLQEPVVIKYVGGLTTPTPVERAGGWVEGPHSHSVGMMAVDQLVLAVPILRAHTRPRQSAGIHGARHSQGARQPRRTAAKAHDGAKARC